MKIRLQFRSRNDYDPNLPMPPIVDVGRIPPDSTTVDVADVSDIEAAVQSAWPDRATVVEVSYVLERDEPRQDSCD